MTAGRDLASARAGALLAATNRFLVAADLAELASDIADAASAMFDAQRLIVMFRDDSGRGPAAVRGYDELRGRRILEVLAAPHPIVDRAEAGEEHWTDDPSAGDFRARAASFGLKAAFVVPIGSVGAISGTLSVGYPDERTFDERFREAARGLAGQAGLAHALLGARAELRASEAALARQVRRTEALLQVSQELASITDPEAAGAIIARAVTRATGVGFGFVARWDAELGSAAMAASSGLLPAEERLARRVRPSADRWGMVRRALDGSVVLIRRPIDPDDFPMELFDRWGLEAAALAPIVIAGRTWGFIALGMRSSDDWEPDSVGDMLGGLAGIAATALARAEAVAALERQADLLEFHVAERTLQLNEAVAELRVASQAKTDFLANVSHELRTPLTAILGFSDVLVQGLDGPLAPDQLEDARTINTSSRHLLELIDDLIDVQQVEDGRIALQPEAVELEPLITSALEQVRPLAGTRGLGLSLEDAGMPRVIEVDRARIHQILLNLLTNAVKFSRPGGSIRVVAATDKTGRARIDVIDTGIGIALGDQARIFEKFQRAASTEFPGTGLGLSISRGLARLHGGELVVDSTVGLGSRFTVTLPVDGHDRGR